MMNMGSEAALWGRMRRNIQGFGTFVRAEMRCHDDFPDVIYLIRGVTGLIELKHVNKWPQPGEGKLKIRSLQKGQARFLRDWCRNGGRAWMLLQVDTDVLLYTGAAAFDFYAQNGMEYRHAIATSSVHATGKFPTMEIVKCLIQ